MYAFLFDRKSATLTVALFLAFLCLLFWAGLALGSRVGPELAKRGTDASMAPEAANDLVFATPASTVSPPVTMTPKEAAPAPTEPVEPVDEEPPTLATEDGTTATASTSPSTTTPGQQERDASPPPIVATTTAPAVSLPTLPPAQGDTEKADATSDVDRNTETAPSPPAPRIVSRMPVEAPSAMPAFGKQAPVDRVRASGSVDPLADTEADAVADTTTEPEPGAGLVDRGALGTALPGEIPAAKQQASELVRPASETAATPTHPAQQKAAAVVSPSTVSPSTVATPIYSVQVGAFNREANARQRADILTRAGYEPYVQAAKTPRGRTIHTVRIGHFTSKREALEAAADFAAREGTPAVIRWQDRP